MDRVLLPCECSPDAFLDKVTPKRKRRADKAAAEAAEAAEAAAPAPAPTPVGKTPSFSSFSSFSSGSGSSSSVRSNTSVCGFQIPKKRPRSDTVNVVVVRSRRDDD